MGNCRSSLTSKNGDIDSVTSQSSFDPQPPFDQQASGELTSTVERSGADGLRELGFEYRFVACERHHAAENTPISSNDAAAGAAQKGSTCFECATRLVHVASGTATTIITEENRREYIADGDAFDEVARACQEVAQERIQNEYGMKIITLCEDPSSRGGPVHAMVDKDFELADPSDRRPIVLVITGRGKSRAGVLSVKQLLVAGMERGTAMSYVSGARCRGMRVVILDPNGRGAQNGMATLELSMDALLRCLVGGNDAPPLYVLTHSAAGGYIVRYILNDDDCQEQSCRRGLLRSMRAVAFTDSTHRIQWAREDRELYEFLQSSRCLYIRNNAVRASHTSPNNDEKEAGDEFELDLLWRRRFGELRTVWAGTTDHSLMCWSARDVIWKFFDMHMVS